MSRGIDLKFGAIVCSSVTFSTCNPVKSNVCVFVVLQTQIDSEVSGTDSKFYHCNPDIMAEYITLTGILYFERLLILRHPLQHFQV